MVVGIIAVFAADNIIEFELSDDAYNATTWNGSLMGATQNAIRDKIETIGAGSGDNVSINGGAVSDPDFVSTADVKFVDTANTITALINADKVYKAHFKDEDWGDGSVSSNTFTIDSGVLDDDNMANDALDPDKIIGDSSDDDLVDDALLPATVTRDTEWDTMAEINAASTDTDAVLDTDIGSTVQGYDADLDDLADGELTGTKVQASSETNSGVVELATTAEIDTGTDNGRAMSPDAFAASDHGIKYIQFVVTDFTTDNAVGDGKSYAHIPAGLDGYDLVECHAEVITAGTTGLMDIQVHELVGAVDMLSTLVSIDSAETGSDSAVTSYTIDTGNDDVSENDLLRIDIKVVHTTAAKGLLVTLGFRKP